MFQDRQKQRIVLQGDVFSTNNLTTGPKHDILKVVHVSRSKMTEDELNDLWEEIDYDDSHGNRNNQTPWLEAGYENDSPLSSAHSKRSRQMLYEYHHQWDD